MKSILRQNAFHFAAKRNLFCGKMQAVLRQNGNEGCRKRRVEAGLQSIKKTEAEPAPAVDLF